MSAKRKKRTGNRALRKVVANLKSVIEEALEPGVFGEWTPCLDPALTNSGLDELCKNRGYGAVIHHVEALWKLRAEKTGFPGSEHSVAACASVRREWIAKAKTALKEAKGA